MERSSLSKAFIRLLLPTFTAPNKKYAQKDIGQTDPLHKPRNSYFQLIFSKEFSHQSLMLTNEKKASGYSSSAIIKEKKQQIIFYRGATGATKRPKYFLGDPCGFY